MNPQDRHHTFLTRPWWHMGQTMEGALEPRINESATRARAGMLNMLSITTIFILLVRPELDPVIYIGPYVIWDMFTAALFGLTPLCPTGVLGTLLTLRIRPQWKPRSPKRTAWLLGGSLGIVCLSMRLLHVDSAGIIGVLAICFALTWLEAVLGFCVGCWLHQQFFKCEDCELPYQRQTGDAG